MAEFCLECWNKLNGTNDPARMYIISRDLDLCEGCGQMKPVIVAYRKGRLRRRLRWAVIEYLERKTNTGGQ